MWSGCRRAPGVVADWPSWAPEPLTRRSPAARGHRTLVASGDGGDDWRTRRTNVVIATGTGSGKSLAYQLPVLAALLAIAAGRPRSIWRRPRRWRRISCAASTALGLPGSAPRRSTETPRMKSASGYARTRASC